MSFAYLPLFTGDYLRDTRHLSPLRHGVYLLCLMHCWDSKGPLPLDEQECAGISNCRSSDEIEALRYIVARFFVRMEDGHYNKRMAEEVAKSERLSSALSSAGMKSAEARRAKARDAARTKAEARFNQGLTKVEPRSVSPSPSPSLTPASHHPPEKSIARGSRLPADFSPDFDFAATQGIQSPQEEANKFRDYWQAQPGQKGVKTDWQATWRNWCRNARPAAGRGGVSKQTALEARNRAVIDEYLRDKP